MKFEKYFDHTLLRSDATKEEIKTICEEAKEHDFASVCVNQYYTSYAKELLQGTTVKTCVVVGFPLGASDGEVKAYETARAVAQGADEIDMVINIGALKDGAYDVVEKDIACVREACKDQTLKVIIETCLLTQDEKKKACELAVAAGADYVKTSTGFSKAGATVEDVGLMKHTVDGRAKVKAAGGIRDLATAEAMIKAGADRLGTSATVKIVSDK